MPQETQSSKRNKETLEEKVDALILEIGKLREELKIFKLNFQTSMMMR